MVKLNAKQKQRVDDLVNDFGENLAAGATEQEFYAMLKYGIELLSENLGETA